MILAPEEHKGDFALNWSRILGKFELEKATSLKFSFHMVKVWNTMT